MSRGGYCDPEKARAAAIRRMSVYYLLCKQVVGEMDEWYEFATLKDVAKAFGRNARVLGRRLAAADEYVFYIGEDRYVLYKRDKA